MTVLTVILNWRTPDMTLEACRAAMAAMEGVPGGITIVDNNSGDGSFERMVAADLPDVRVLQAGRNGGFGAGNNYGIRRGLADGLKPDFVYVLNSDAFPQPDAIRALRDYMLAHPEVGFAGSATLNGRGEAERTAFRFPSIGGELEAAARLGPVSRLLHRSIVAMPIPQGAGQVDWLAGASLMIRRDVLDRIGLFDEAFFLYFEETDLCLRAARAGVGIHYVPESVVTHIGGVSTGVKVARRMPRYWFDSRWRYFTKNHGRGYAALATVAHVLGGLLWRARMLVQDKVPGDPPRFLRDLMGHAMRFK